MHAIDGRYLTLLVPADADNRFDPDAPEPWLFEGSWGGTRYFGEVKVEAAGIGLHWSDGDHMNINLDAVPITVGRVFTVRSSEGHFHYTVQDATRV
jgi:hypothetical protein